jgi:drug/metabolite transporter (DMT)-like permease
MNRAVLHLTLATAAWGLSFPTAKAAMLAQDVLIPGCPKWFHAAFLLFNRMVLSTLVMVLVLRACSRGVRRLELRQGLELGLFGGLGMLLQTDAQNYIDASTSAFFTQFTCIFVPLYVALRSRRAPSVAVIAACVLVFAGCTLLSGVNFHSIGFGRGEWETILGALLFTGQILCLERKAFASNDAGRTATVMFAVKGLVFLPFVIGGGTVQAVSAYTSGPMLMLTVFLALFCTVYSYVMMTRWQPSVTATQAGLIYATEPIFATVWALFLPGLFSQFAKVNYANEKLTESFYIGGGLILLANLVLILRPDKPPHGDPPPIT